MLTTGTKINISFSSSSSSIGLNMHL